MTRSAESEERGLNLQNEWADSFRCETTCPSDQHPAYEHWEQTKGRESAISQVPHVGAAICSRPGRFVNSNIKRVSFLLYLSPFGRVTMDLITTMWIPRNDRFVFLDKISFLRVCCGGGQCRGYVRAVRDSPRHFCEISMWRERIGERLFLVFFSTPFLRIIVSHSAWNSIWLGRFIERQLLRICHASTSPYHSWQAPPSPQPRYVYFNLLEVP